jgi:hypothetical protein
VGDAQLIGRLAAVVLFACLALYFLVRGLAPGPRSLRLANLALACGLTVFVLPEFALGLVPAEAPAVFLVSASVRVPVGIAGVVLAAKALGARGDGGAGAARPVAALALSVLHAAAGLGLLAFVSPAGTSSPWVYESPDGAFRLALPSGRWQKAPTGGDIGIVLFGRLGPHMQAVVRRVEREQTRDDFEEAAEAFRRVIAANPKRAALARFREEATAAGNLYSYCTLMDATPQGDPVFVAHVVAWSPAKRVLVEVVCEGVPAMLSRTGRAAELHTFEKDAEAICLSVE